MKISTEINSTALIVGYEKAVELVAKAGFDAFDFSMMDMCRYDWRTQSAIISDHPLQSDNYAAFAKKISQIGLDNGIVCNQSHAPFPVRVSKIRSYLKRAIECTATAGGKHCIIHPDDNKSPEENAEMYFELLPFAKEHGVKIATENMWRWKHSEIGPEHEHAIKAACSDPASFVEHLNVVDDDYFVACLDIGHAEMKGLNTSAVEMIMALGDKLECLHIHDNDKWHDSHLLPYKGFIDFEAVVKALKKINYKGYFTLEADNHLKDFFKDNVLDGLKEMAITAKKLADLYEKI